MKDQYLLLVFAFAFMAAYRLTIGFNLRGVLQMSLFAIPLTAMIAQGEEGVTAWAYVCLGVAVAWWFVDLYIIFSSARMAYHGRQRFLVKRQAQPGQRAGHTGTTVAKPASSAKASTPASKPVSMNNRMTGKTNPVPEHEKVELVSLKPQDIQFGPVIGLVEDKPIYEWVKAQGRAGRAEYVGILGRGAELEDNDLMLAPGLVYRWTTTTAAMNEEGALEAI